MTNSLMKINNSLSVVKHMPNKTRLFCFANSPINRINYLSLLKKSMNNSNQDDSTQYFFNIINETDDGDFGNNTSMEFEDRFTTNYHITPKQMKKLIELGYIKKTYVNGQVMKEKKHRLIYPEDPSLITDKKLKKNSKGRYYYVEYWTREYLYYKRQLPTDNFRCNNKLFMFDLTTEIVSFRYENFIGGIKKHESVKNIQCWEVVLRHIIDMLKKYDPRFERFFTVNEEFRIIEINNPIISFFRQTYDEDKWIQTCNDFKEGFLFNHSFVHNYITKFFDRLEEIFSEEVSKSEEEYQDKFDEYVKDLLATDEDTLLAQIRRTENERR